MQRTALKTLLTWLNGYQRKPLVMRGARQTGKTWLVRQLANEANRRLVELNFERKPDYASLFESNNPKEILMNLSGLLDQEIDPAQAILFLDEIQAAPHLLAKLRWFAEDLPELPVIATGSL